MKILLVEDDPNSAALVNHIIEDIKRNGNGDWEKVSLECIPSDKCIYDNTYDIVLHGYKSLQMLHNLSLYDSLTGLYNRRGFFHFIDYEIKLSDRKKDPFLLIYIDVDGLKRINDTKGHIIGDKILIRVATILNSVFRKSDIIARLGGDEFAVFPTEMEDEDSIRDRLYDRVRINNNSHEDTLSLSVGIVAYKPNSGLSVDDLVRIADSAMYKNKNGKAR